MFGIEKTGSIEVFQNRVVRDGYDVKDLDSRLTEDKAREILNTTETDSTVLWSYLVDKVEGKDIQILEVPTQVATDPVVVPAEEAEITKTKTKKKNA